MPLVALAILFLIATPHASCAEAANELRVRNGIKELVSGLKSSDEAVRKRSLEAVLPNERVLQKLIGDNARILWPHMPEFLDELRAQTAEMKKDYDRRGALKEIELTEIRGHQGQEWTAKVAKEIPLYRAALVFEHGASESSVYTVIDDKMYWIRGLDLFDRFIEKLKPDRK